LRLAIAASHAPEIAAGHENASFCRTLAFAGHVAEIWTNPKTAAATATARQKAEELLQMPADEFENLLGEVAASLPEITANLDIEIGSEDMLRRLLDQAREELVTLNLRSQEQVRLAQDMAKRDGPTSLYNRSYLEEILPQAFGDAVNRRQPLSAVFLDIDYFKKVNDTYGHQTGDAVIMSVAKTVQSAVRSSDLAVRYGGEEFVCLLANTNETGAKVLAERIRAAVASTPLQLANGTQVSVTVSLGCATFSSRHGFENAFELLREADRCLYAAKRAGRNQVVSYQTLPAMPGRS
jgi:diguanylate cyclase (GGDEF)-like protein